MIDISEDFIKDLKLPKKIEIKDIIFTGSLTNYNWSKYSDIDLHVILDFKELDMDEEMLKEYFSSKKIIWNNEHEIKINDFPIEMYVQDINKIFHGESIYSILNNKWKKKPIKEKFMIDKNKIKEKANKYINLLKDIKKDYNEANYDKVINEVDKIKNKLKKMRLSGLESGGEYSIENFVFKVLRRSSFMELLNNYKIKAYDKKMSI
jgi:predicted nucleotidyltransferase